jgi:AmiR/NasT family two-component response regulator
MKTIRTEDGVMPADRLAEGLEECRQHVCGAAESDHEAMALAFLLQPDVLILNINN